MKRDKKLWKIILVLVITIVICSSTSSAVRSAVYAMDESENETATTDVNETFDLSVENIRLKFYGFWWLWQDLYICCDVKNEGNSEAYAQVRTTIGPLLPPLVSNKKTIGTFINSGEEETFKIWKTEQLPLRGLYVIVSVVDFNDMYEETDEGNNALARIFYFENGRVIPLITFRPIITQE